MGSSNAKPMCTTVPTKESPVEIVVGTVVPDDTESLVLPEQYMTMKNILDTDKLDVFDKYLTKRVTVTDTDIRTQELKLIFDAGAFKCAERYLTHMSRLPDHTIDYSVALASRHTALSVPASHGDAMQLIGYMHVFKMLKTHVFEHSRGYYRDTISGPLFKTYSIYHTFEIYTTTTHGLEFMLMLEDPAVSYSNVDCWLWRVFELYAKYNITMRKTEWPVDLSHLTVLLKHGTYRAASCLVANMFTINSAWRCDTRLKQIVSPYLGDILFVNVMDVSPTWYTSMLCGEHVNAAGAKKLAKSKCIDRIFECVDLNETSVNLDVFMQELPDAEFARAIELVWRVPRRQHYEKIRPVK